MWKWKKNRALLLTRWLPVRMCVKVKRERNVSKNLFAKLKWIIHQVFEHNFSLGSVLAREMWSYECWTTRKVFSNAMNITLVPLHSMCQTWKILLESIIQPHRCTYMSCNQHIRHYKKVRLSCPWLGLSVESLRFCSLALKHTHLCIQIRMILV